MNEDKLSFNKIYVDVINGFSKGLLGDGFIYVKHLGTFEENDIELVKHKKYHEGISKGLPVESDKLLFLNKEGLWSKEDDQELFEYKQNIEGLIKTKSNLPLISQIKEIERQISELEGKYAEKYNIKYNLLGLTAEKFAEKQGNNQYIFSSIFKDKLLTIPYFDDLFSNEVEQDELNEVIRSFNNAIDHLDDTSIKKTALSQTFQNIYGLADGPYNFLGKPIAYLSYYQVNLLSYANYYKHILSELSGKIPEGIRNNPEKLESFYLSSKNIQKHKDKNMGNEGNLEFFGVQKEDMETVNVDFNKEQQAAELLESQGGFSLMDAIRLGL